MSRIRAALFILAFSVALFGASRAACAQEQINGNASLTELTARMEAAVQSANVKEINELAFEIETVRTKSGYSDLEPLSTALLTHAQFQLDKNDREMAAFFVRKAIQLSPNIPALLIHSARLAHASGNSEIKGLYGSGFKQTITQFHSLLTVLIQFIYPILWGLTLGFVAACVLYLAVSIPRILRVASTYLPTWGRGYLTPPLIAAAFLVPLWLGPLWCVAVWSILAILSASDRQWLTFIGGSILCLWGLLIPFREHGLSWLSNSGIESMLRVENGIIQPGDAERLERLVASEPDNGTAYFALGKVYLRTGRFDMAQAAFIESQKFLAEETYTQHAMALVDFLKGDREASAKRFAILEQSGIDSPEFNFNYSKLRFDIFDTEASRDLFDKANEEDPVQMAKLQEMEEKFGFNSPLAVALPQLPKSLLISALLNAPSRSEQAIVDITKSLSGWDKPFYLFLAGGSLIMLFFLVSMKRRTHMGAGYYAGYTISPILTGILRVLPSGTSALRGHAVRCFLLCALLAIFVQPLFQWPAETQHLLHLFPGFELHYTFVFWFLVAAISYLGFYTYEEEAS